MTLDTPPAAPDWDKIRLRYEAGTEQVKAIAADCGLSGIALSLKAKADGWTMRGSKKAAGRQQPQQRHKPEPTRDTLRRLKDMLQHGIQNMEAHLKLQDFDIPPQDEDRNLRAMNTLVRTLDKVLELERKDTIRRRKARTEFKHFDEQQRAELAEKIARLQERWHRHKPVADAADQGRGGAEQAVALLGKA